MRTFKPRESSFQTKAIKYLKKNGAVVVNYNPGLFGRKGISDLLVCYKGRYLALECKRPGEELSDAQKEFLSDVVSAGGVGALIETIEDVVLVLEEVRNDLREQQSP